MSPAKTSFPQYDPSPPSKAGFITLLVVIVALLWMVSCEVRGMKNPQKTVVIEGLVTAKQWVPASDQYLMMTVGNLQVPTWIHHDQQWWITVAGQRVQLYEQDWKPIQIGEFWSNRGK